MKGVKYRFIVTATNGLHNVYDRKTRSYVRRGFKTAWAAERRRRMAEDERSGVMRKFLVDFKENPAETDRTKWDKKRDLEVVVPARDPDEARDRAFRAAKRILKRPHLGTIREVIE